MPHLINIPPFMFKSKNVETFSIMQKIYFIIKGKLVGLVINKTNKSLFCRLINFLFPKGGKLHYEENLYFYSKDDLKIFYPNKRVIRYVDNYPLQLLTLFNSYCLNSINFQTKDVIIDCGANVGELFFAFKYKDLNIKYIGFEPDKETYNCLKKNIKSDNSELFNIALNNETKITKFYLDNEGGNSSLIDFGTNKFVDVQVKKMDDMEINEKIKLFKIDAEGNEPEVLMGATSLLKNTEYISVDFGDERGIEQKTTIVEVNNFLTENNFKLIDFSDYRLIGLYKNNTL